MPGHPGWRTVADEARVARLDRPILLRDRKT